MFIDHFDNGSVDLRSFPSAGTITETGSQLTIDIPDSAEANITQEATGAATAYTAPGIISPHRVNGPFRIDLKVDQISNAGNNNTISGLLSWEGAIEDLWDHKYCYDFGYHSAEGQIIVNSYLNSWSGTRLASSGGRTKPDGASNKHIYRIFINPLDKRIQFADEGFGEGNAWYLNPNTIGFAYSTDQGATWTWWHQRTMEFRVDWIGAYMRSWSPGAGVTHQAVFDYYEISAYDWDSKHFVYLPSNSSMIDTPEEQDKRLYAALTDDAELLREASTSRTAFSLPSQGRGALIPGPIRVADEEDHYQRPHQSLEDDAYVRKFPDDPEGVLVAPGPRQPWDQDGYFNAGALYDGFEQRRQSGIVDWFSLPELKEPFRFRDGVGSQVGGLEDSLFWDLDGADYAEDQNDGDGTELLYSGDLVEAYVIDTTKGSFGDPTNLNHHGFAKDGKPYWNGVEINPVNFSLGTVAGGPNREVWPFWRGSTGPFGQALDPAWSFSFPSDHVLQIDAVGVTNTSGPQPSPFGMWSLEGDIDVTIDFSDWSASGNNGTFYLWLQWQVVGGSTAYTYVACHWTGSGKQYIKNVHTPGSSSYSTVSTSDTAGKLRLTRVGTTISAYYWTGSDWQLIGGGYNWAAASGPMFPVVYSYGGNGFTGSIKFTNLQVNAGTLINTAPWYRESAGAHRGTQPDMPDKLLAVAGDASVDLIDPATDKLWMRFIRGGTSTANCNILHHFGSGAQRVRGISWANGKLVLAYGTAPTDSEEGGTAIIDFVTNNVRLAREGASSITGGYFTGWPNSIVLRNTSSNGGYHADYAVWHIPDYRVYDVSIIISGTHWLIASATNEGLAIHMANESSWVDPGWPTPFRSYSSELTRLYWCQFRESDEAIFYADDTNLYSRDRNNGSTGWEDVMDAGTFTAEYSKAHPGTRTSDLQYRGVLYSSYVFSPASEGVYRIDWPSGSWELFYGKAGSGATHEILTNYDTVNSISFAEDGAQDLLVVGLESGGTSRINVVKLATNVLYGTTVPGSPVKAPRVVAS